MGSRKSEWFWELYQTLISAKTNLETVNYDPIPTSPRGPSLPSAPPDPKGTFSKPRSNSSLCFMLRELCKGFTFCLDGFPEQEGFFWSQFFTCMGTSLASRNLSVKVSQHSFLWELNAIVSLLKMNGHHKWISHW